MTSTSAPSAHGLGAEHAAAQPDAPFAELGRHAAALWSSARLYAAIVADGAVGGLHRFLVVAVSTLVALYAIVLLMSLGGYFLVTGLALGLAELAGSPWLGRAIAGAIFLIGPAALGLLAVGMLRRGRERRLAAAYRQRLAAGATP